MWNYSFDVLRRGEDLRGSADGVMGLTADWVGLDGKEKKTDTICIALGVERKQAFFRESMMKRGFD